MGSGDLEKIAREGITPGYIYQLKAEVVNLETICKNIINSMDTRSFLFPTEDKSITIRNAQTWNKLVRF